MKIKDLIKLSLLELTRYKSITTFLILNLTLGLIGFFLLQIFQQSLTLQSAERAQVALGGDISISARRTFTDTEVKKWESQLKFEKVSKFYSMFSMLRTTSDSRLVNVGVFDSEFPLYGQFKLSDINFTDDKPRVWVDPEILDIINLKIGDSVEIGEQKFIYSGFIQEDPTRLFRGATFASRVLIHQKYLPAAGLIKEGSTFTESWKYRLLPDVDIEANKALVEKVMTDPVVRIESTRDSAEDSNRALKYFTDYLGLVALVALGLCFLCGSYLLQWTFLTKKKTIAIYKTLGLSDEKIISIYLLQNLIISALACLLSVIIVKGSMPLVQSFLINASNLPLQLVFGFKALVITSLIAIFGPILIVVPQIMQIIDLRPLMLLQNVDVKIKKGISYFVWLICTIALFWALAFWQSHSYKVAGIFTGSLVGLIIFFQFINRIILFALERASARFNWLLKYSIKGLTRKPASSGLVFTTMCLATLVLSLLPHVKTSIISEVKPQDTAQMPSLFMFDIQPEQTEGIRKAAKEILNYELVMSPMVRSRILKINDKNYEKIINTGEMQTREADAEARSRNRGLNLTYRDYLQESEMLIKGNLQTNYLDKNKLPQISLEKRYADRMNISLGDEITFDVQGVELVAQVGSLRQVRWTSFQPNFFILFPLGVLEDAPQIFLASVNHAQDSKLKEFQLNVSNEFKNVSIIDISRTIETTLKYVDQMSIGLEFMAWLAVLVGLFVFIVLLNTQIKERLQEMNLLQILGARNESVYKIMLTQFAILIVTSITFGVLLGLILAWVIISFFFDIKTVYDLNYLLLLAAILLPVCGVALYFGLTPLKKLNPMDLIRQQ
ncbi:MAG: FtsX-like permease family protein [Pseudobdellovibrio sp.]